MLDRFFVNFFPGIWGAYDGAMLVRGRNVKTESFVFKSRSDERILDPRFIFSAENLVYWSPNDRCLAIVTNDRPIKWIEIGQRIPERIAGSYVSVMDLLSCPNGVVANLRGSSRAGSFKIDIENEKVEQISNALEVRTKPYETTYALLTLNGSVLIRNDQKEELVQNVNIPPDNGDYDWDFSSTRNAICFTDGMKIFVSDSDGLRKWRTNFASNVCFFDERNKILVSQNKFLLKGQNLKVYDFKGSRIGTPIRSNMPIRQPILNASIKEISLLEKLRIE